MSRLTRKAATTALIITVGFGALASTAVQATADTGRPGAQTAQTAQNKAGAPDRWNMCWMAPAGSLAMDFATGDASVCFSGSGYTDDFDNDVLAEVNTGNNVGTLWLDTNGAAWEKPFSRNQTFTVPADTRVTALSMN
ncbi:hypothetical protein E1281_37475 [Actinomadura sp. KC345]|uniref:hypothetical protein n=1 Tax=Actinomadura sp. KC345 TaxID=2530371 RepID=UPI00104EE0B3|nr:hypothetical protein [Actinomadura sp. KC345]TDC41336.1 hypothetical protein E1281_37475 [Actinomadura sp. KC345]